MSELKAFTADENEEKHPGSDSEDDSQDDAVSIDIRGKWGGKFEFLLTIVGYTVGLGNIWRFPFLCYRNGGGAFLIPFFLFLILCGGPLYYMEACLGQFSGKSPVNVWTICPLFKGMGFLMVWVSTVVLWYFAIVFAWVLYFLVNSFYPVLPWASCDNWWNTPNCRDLGESQGTVTEHTTTHLVVHNTTTGSHNNSPSNGHGIFNTSVRDVYTKTVSIPQDKSASPGVEFWLNNVLRSSDGIENLGVPQWHLVICLFVAWLMTFLCLVKGVKTVGKVVYVTATMPFLLLTVLLVRGITLDGSLDGIELYLKPDFSKLAKLQVWLEAAVQVFYSLGPAWGGVITMASYNKFHHPCLRDTIIVCVADGFTAFYGGLVVFSVLGFMSKETGVPIEEVAIAGPGLAFIAYPQAISRLPFPQLWAVLFFTTLVFVGIDTQFGMFETISNAVMDTHLDKLHRYRVQVNAILCFLLFLSGLPLTTNGGLFIFRLFDWYSAAFCILFGSVIECTVVAWFYGADRFSKDIEFMLGRPINIVTRLSWCLFIPSILLVTFIIVLTQYAAPDYGDGYRYPMYVLVIGNILAVIPVVGVVVVAVIEALKRKGGFIERLESAVQPSSDWFPNDKKIRNVYLMEPYRPCQSFAKRLKRNLWK